MHVQPVQAGVGNVETTKVLPKRPKIVSFVEPKLRQVIDPPLGKEKSVVTQPVNPTRLIELKKELLVKYGSTVELELAKLDSFDFATLPLTSLGKEAYNHTLTVYDELVKGNYTQKAAHTYLHWVTQAFVNHLSGGAEDAARRVEALKQASLDYTAEAVSENMHELKQPLTHEPFAVLKQSRKIQIEDPWKIDRVADGSKKEVPLNIKNRAPLSYSSFLMLLPDMPLTTRTCDHELIGSEMDALLGLDRAPTILRASFENQRGELVEGSLIEYIPNPKTAGSDYLFEADQAPKLMQIDPSKVHLTAISGMLKGLSAHHWDNYVVREMGERAVDIREIDLEEIMIPFNRVPRDMVPSIARGLPEEQIETIRKTIVLCRLFVLGLPQCKMPLDCAMLLSLLHPSLRAILDSYHKNVLVSHGMHPSCLKAQIERLERLQGLASKELSQNAVTATARDLYFALFGGKEVYEIAKSKGFPDAVAFNQVIGDPYPGAYKDFDNPQQMKASTLLQPATESDSPERKIYKKNFQILEAS